MVVSAVIGTGESGVGIGIGVGFVIGGGGGRRRGCESPLEIFFLDKGVRDEGWACGTFLRCHDGEWCIGAEGEVMAGWFLIKEDS